MQYLDDLEDLVYAAALILERIRRAFRFLAVTVFSIALQASTLMLALAQPPLALAVASLLAVGLLYRAVVHHSTRARISPQAASHP